ncbi:hypothetical protein FJZ36_18665 [Candidatus Poribacteria bacterium]|nr:hypothetical protein [Candidatus Poribacteria bacterium]
MRCSIFHLFAHLAANSHRLKTVSALTSYPFPTGVLDYPNLAIAFEEAGAPASHHGLSVVNIIHRLNGPFLGYQTAL